MHHKVLTSRTGKSAVIMGLLACACSALAQQANVFISPQSLVFHDKTRSEVVHVVNRGERTGVFAVQWVDHTMKAEGSLQKWEPSELSPYSLQPYVRYSPRRVTLKPGETQVVRISLRKPATKLANGEYFSHLRVLTLNDNLEAEQEKKKQEDKDQEEKDQEQESILVKSRMAISIPVLWRHGKESKQAAKVEVKELKDKRLSLHIARTGLFSTRGYLHVMHDDGAATKPIAAPQPFIIYANLDSRDVSVSLTKTPVGDGELIVYYSDSIDNTKTLLGEGSLTL